MKFLFTLLSLCFCFTMLHAQSKVELTGQVKDAQTKKNLEFCAISVFNQKDSLITGSVTNEKGYFTIPLNGGRYKVIASFIGYKADTVVTTISDASKFFGVMKLQPDIKKLSEVSIKSSAKESQLDRDVQVVTDKMKEGTANTKDVLDKMTGVDIDRYSNTIKVDNDSKVIILVDGIEKDQEYIKNLAPERLKKIEVIRDPGGRYALEGYSAVINVILKKDYQGTELYASHRSMNDLDASKQENIPVQSNLSGTVNYVYNKLNLYAKVSQDINNFNLQSNVLKEYDNGLSIENVPPAPNDMNNQIKQRYHNYTLGADYYLNPKHTISYESNFNTQPLSKNSSKETANVLYRLNGDLFDNILVTTINKSKSFSMYQSLFYEGKLSENDVINSNLTYSNYNSSYINEYIEGTMTNRTETGNDRKNSTRFYAEYTHTFPKNMNLQIGYGNSFEDQKNKFSTGGDASNFSYTDQQHKLYSYYAWQISKKFGFKLGGVAETSAPNAGGIKNNYTIVQPYADIKFTPSANLDFKVKYRASSTYPSISQTNPFTTMIDLQSVRTGNPTLSPEVTHKISLQTNILQGLASIEPYYHFSDNYIAEFGTLRSDGLFAYSYSNAGNYKNYGIEARLAVPIGKNFVVQSDVDFYNSKIKTSGNNNALNAYVMSNQLIYQNQKYASVAGFQYQKNMRKYISTQGYGKGDNDFWIVFVQQPFFKQRLSVMLVYFTPITWGVDFNQGSYIHTTNYTEQKNYDISLLKNMLLLEISYRFNYGKQVTLKNKKVEQINEKNGKGIF